ncbi:MAG: YIP1 family protein [Acidobacteria bacterium]|nr:YIP1 family protein [Acidobacteriota bacterium]
MAIGGLLGPVIVAVIIGAVYLFGFNVFLSAGIKFKTALSITAHALLVGLVSTPLVISIVLLKPAGEVNPEHLIASNVGEFLSNEAPKWLLTLTGALDIFTIWCLVLLAIGFAAANPKKISKAGAYGVVFGIWAVYVFVKVAWAAI